MTTRREARERHHSGVPDTTREGPGWKAAALASIPALGKCADLSYFRGWTDNPEYGERWHSVRLFFDIKAFGANGYEANAGEELILSHREADHGGYEELYVLLQGRAAFVCDGKEFEVGAGEMVFVQPEVHRSGVALESPTVWMAFGGWAGRPYEHWNSDH